jgi:protein-disulfide isomerase
VPTSPPSDPGAPDAARGAPGSPAIPAAILVLALGGLYVAAYLWLLYHRAHAGAGPSFCDISERWSCTDVALSKWSVFLGVPQAAWGALSYLTVAGLAISALARRRPSPSWPGGLLLVVTGFMTAWSVVLAGISELVLHKFCFMCATSWTISLILLALSVVMVVRAGGVGPALRADVRALAQAPAASASAGAVLAVAALGLLVWYAAAPRPAQDRRVLPVGPAGSLVIYEYSDYLCPFCAAMHAQEKTIAAKRPDVRLVRRHFPLDATCNPAIKATLHEGSCDLARGGICAEKQGRFEDYDDAAFAAQAAHPGPEDIAAQIGLDVTAFRACLTSPETQKRLAADIQSGIEAKVHGTPSFLVQGRLVAGPELLGMLGLPCGDLCPQD